MTPAITGAPHPPTTVATPGKVRDAAQQFEALLVAQLLQSMRAGESEDQASATVFEMAEQEFARLLAARGDFGIARMLAASLQDARG